MSEARSAMLPSILTIGHSTHPQDRFLALLTQHGVEALADIRRFPGSRKFPQFNRDDLAPALREAGIEYHWLGALGGRRGKRKDGSSSVNLGLRNAGFSQLRRLHAHRRVSGRGDNTA
jgi:uncharacterized protein (DUF488 family)